MIMLRRDLTGVMTSETGGEQEGGGGDEGNLMRFLILYIGEKMKVLEILRDFDI
jgi:hypothetical protein